MPFGVSTGAGVLFGVTGGVTEAVIRRLSSDKSSASLRALAYTGIRGMNGSKEASILLDGREVRIAVISGLANAEALLGRMKNGEHFDFVEVMACPGGCVSGGGQPFASPEARAQRGNLLYTADRMNGIKRSEENPLMMSLYTGLLKGRVQELLHVHYHTGRRGAYDA